MPVGRMWGTRVPLLVSKDVAANRLFLALDCFHVSKHAVRLEPFSKFRCIVKQAVQYELIMNGAVSYGRTEGDGVAVQAGERNQLQDETLLCKVPIEALQINICTLLNSM
jgi:hypothetical protein